MSTKLRGLLVLFGILFGGILFAQEKTVTGTVTDADGFPLSDVSVMSTSGEEVFTNSDGKYSMTVNEGEVLTIEAMGMGVVKVTVGAGNVYNANLKDTGAIELEGAVVTALGITREKKSLGYATQEVSGDVLAKSRNSNAISALSGNVAGAQINSPSGSLGGSTRITLRGINSITQENKPLIVVDGIPLSNFNANNTNTQRGAGGRDYGDGIFDINPDDIAEVNVLTGGPASALYGSRASNGVIMITTKKGKKGRKDITVNTGISFESIAYYPKLQKLYGGGSTDDFEQVDINGTTYNIAEFGTDESWGPRLDGTPVLQWNNFDPEFAADYLNPQPWLYPKHDAISLFDVGISYNNSVNFSNGDDNTNFKLSLANVSQTGILPNSRLERSNIGMSLGHKFDEKFSINSNFNFARTYGRNRPEQGYGDNSIPQKIWQWGQTQLDYAKLRDYKLANGGQRSWNRSSWDDGTPAYSDNVYWTLFENISKDERNRFFGNIELKYEFSKGLYAMANVSGDTYNLEISERVAVGSAAQSEYSYGLRKYSEYNYEGRLHYDKSFGDFSLNSFVGMNRRQINGNYITGNTRGGLVVPNIYTLGNSMNDPFVSTAKFASKRVNSVYGMVSLGYKNFLFLDATGRQDWFSTLPSDNNTQFYPSITGSILLSELMDASWVNYAKLRGGFSQTSNDVTEYQTRDYFNAGANFGGPSFGLSNTKSNDMLKPEVKDSWEVGLDLQMFRNRVGLNVTYYEEKITDLLVPVQHSYSTGYNFKWLNAGEMSNKGIQASLSLVPIRTNDFEWNLTTNFSKNDNTVTKVANDMDAFQLSNAPFLVSLWAIEGEKYGMLRGYDFAYDSNGNKIVDEFGVYKKSDQVENLGSILPDYNLGVRNTFTYKSFDFSFLIDMQKGGHFYSTTHMWGNYSGMLEETAANNVREDGLVLDGVMDDGTGNYVANNILVDAQTYFKSHYNGVDAQNIFKADYIKLREVTLSYSIPQKMVGPFNGITISAFGRNLAMWGEDKKGFDPEMASYGSGNIQGLEGGSLPSTRTYGMNLKFQF